MAPRRTQTTAAKTTAEKTADDDKTQETAAEQQGKGTVAKDDGQAKAEEKPKAEDKGADEKPAPKTQPKADSKAEAKTEDKVDITKGSENRDPIPTPEKHQDRAMNQVDSQVSNAASVGVEGLEEDARKRMLQIAQIDTSSPSGYTDVFRAMVHPPENAVKASKAEAKSVDSRNSKKN